MMLVGICVMRTAESVLLTCCPPAPLARYVSTRTSSGLTSISTSSDISGSTSQDTMTCGASRMNQMEKCERDGVFLFLLLKDRKHYGLCLRALHFSLLLHRRLNNREFRS